MKPILLEGMSQILPDSRDMLVVIFQIALKATALIVMTYAAHSLAGRRRALLRSVCWNTCLVGLLLVPVACLTFPRLTLPVLPSQDRVAGPSTPQTRVETATDFDRFDVKNQSRLAIQAAAITEPRSSMPDFEIRKSSTTGLEPVQSLAPIRDWRDDATVIGLGLYLSITTLLLLRLGLSLRAIQRLRRDCLPVDASIWVEGLSRSASKVGITRPVQLLMSDQISVPIVIGWLNPAVILPRSLTDTTTSGLVDAVLLHELAHIRRGDFGCNLLHRVVMALYWPHQLVWPLARIIGAVREQACDDLCVHMLGGPNSYHDSLVEVAAGLLIRPEPSLGMAMARPTALGQRIEWIHRTRGAADCLLRWPVRLAIASTIISMAGMIGSVELARASAKPVEMAQASKESAKSDPKLGLNSKTPEAIEITVLAKDTGKPLKDARIEAYIDRKMEHLRTDASGKARIDLNRRMFLDMISMDLWADGYVQQRRAFSEKGQEKQPIPAALTIELLPGEETLGGRVVNEKGQPIAGAKVEIWGHLGEKKEPHELAYHVDALTDNQGQWRCRSFRKMSWSHLYISHPDFLADTDQTPRVHGRISPDREPAASEQPMQALRDFTDVQVMKKGIRVEGWVADTAGKPVHGAEIGWIVLDRSGPFQPESWLAQADSNGRFALPHARAGQIVIQVKASGHAPELKMVTVKQGLEPLRITLGRPQKLLGRVVDTKGAPIAGCEVRVDSWHGYGGPVFYLKSDAEGRFRWDESPVGDVLVSVIREGFESILRFRVNPTGGEIPITLKRSLNVSGPILDARTGDPIKANAEIDFGTMDPATGQISWKGGMNFLYSDRSIRVAAMDGQIMASLDAEAFPDYRLRIRIKGYHPLESRVFRSDEGQVAYDFRLIKDNTP